MPTDLQTARWFYRKLLTLYPRPFREQLGESMERTFNDLCNEHTRRSKRVPGFLLSIFVETGVGIVYEHFLLFKEMNPMQKALTNFGLSAFISFLLTLPFLLMEIVNRRNANYSLVFMIIFLVACIISAGYYKNYMLGYGPHESASEHGKSLDSLFNITLFFTGIVFFLTQIALAPDEVLRAIVKFLTPGVRRATRVAARQVFLSFPVERHAPPRPRRPPRPRPGDRDLLLRLTTLQAELNLTHFGGQLATLPIRLSSRMRRRLGELRLERKTGRAVHIGLNRRHALRDPWPEVRDTLLHELVHQWQAETGRPVDHGREFRRMAREVGIVPRAVRTD